MRLDEIFQALKEQSNSEDLIKEKEYVENEIKRLHSIIKKCEKELASRFFSEVSEEILEAAKFLYFVINGVEKNGVKYEINQLSREEVDKLIERATISYCDIRTIFRYLDDEKTKNLVKKYWGDTSLLEKFREFYVKFHRKNYHLLYKIGKAMDNIDKLSEELNKIERGIKMAKIKENLVKILKENTYIDLNVDEDLLIDSFNEVLREDVDVKTPKPLPGIPLNSDISYGRLLLKLESMIQKLNLIFDSAERAINYYKQNKGYYFVVELNRIKELVGELLGKKESSQKIKRMINILRKMGNVGIEDALYIKKDVLNFLDNIRRKAEEDINNLNEMKNLLEEFYMILLAMTTAEISRIGIPLMKKCDDYRLFNAISYYFFLKKLESIEDCELNFRREDTDVIFTLHDFRGFIKRVVDKYLKKKYGKYFNEAVKDVMNYRKELEEIIKELRLVGF